LRILITGGAGFIGSHIVDAYLAAGHEVLIVDNFWSHGGARIEHIDPRARLVEIDIRDKGLAAIFNEFQPQIVNHHAAQHSVAIGSREPAFDADVNVMGLLNVLDNSVRVGVKKVIFASSGATFGEPDKLPMDESTPQRPASPYGITKMVTEHYLRFYKSEHNLDFTALRYGNVFGPRQDPNGEAGVISIFIGKFLAKTGVRIDSDGEQTRDYVYVGDVARANLAALEKGGGTCYVIGTGVRTSVNRIYESLVEVTGYTPEVTRAPKRAGDVRDAQFMPTLAGIELGWKPEVDLLTGMRATFEYFRDLGSA
jgi:UDP-glucose 4-epimerase